MATEGLAGAVLTQLAARGWTLATCESITGGGIGAALTSVPGSSAVFRGGLITYASDLKVTLAGVNADYIARCGVINEETAEQMARGVIARCGSDVGVAVSGVAGPEGEDGEPPGVVCIAACTPERSLKVRLKLTGTRTEIRAQTIVEALRLVLQASQERASA